MDSIKDLQPNIVWKNFYSLTQIPRPSKHEEKVVAFIKKFGEDLGLETIVDEIGNVIIRKPATPGYENRKCVILQAHIDMVPQKNSDKVHDFEKDPIITHIENGWVKAEELLSAPITDLVPRLQWPSLNQKTSFTVLLKPSSPLTKRQV